MSDNQVNIEVKEMPELNTAYIRNVGPFKGDTKLFENLFNKLMSWAGPRNLLRFPETLCISAYHDDPNTTDPEKLRLSVCITVPEGTEVDGEIGLMTIPGGKFAVARFELKDDECENAWNSVIGGWLPDSGYKIDERLCYEIYRNNPKEHPEGKCIMDIVIPVTAKEK